MKLAAILRPDHVVVPLPGGSLSDAAMALFEKAAIVGELSDTERMRDRLAGLTSEDVVALPDRAFIIHLRTDSVQDALVLAGASTQPICRGLSDSESQCARLVFLLLAPSRRAAEHLQLVGALERFLSKPAVTEEIIAQNTPDALMAHLSSLEFEVPQQLRVRDVMSVHFRTTSPDASLRDAAREMVKMQLSALIVVDGDARVVGVLGERELMRDLLTNYLQGDTALRDAPTSTGRRRVRDVMTRQVMGVSPDQPLSDVASIMVNKHAELIPVIGDGKLTGVLMRSDFLRKLIGY